MVYIYKKWFKSYCSHLKDKLTSNKKKETHSRVRKADLKFLERVQTTKQKVGSYEGSKIYLRIPVVV